MVLAWSMHWEHKNIVLNLIAIDTDLATSFFADIGAEKLCQLEWANPSLTFAVSYKSVCYFNALTGCDNTFYLALEKEKVVNFTGIYRQVAELIYIFL